MTTFFSSLVLYGGAMLAFTVPLIVVARQRRRPALVRGFLVSAGISSLLIATTAATSERLVARCQAAGNTACIDLGSAGLQMLIAVVYSVVALTAAVLVYRD